MQSTQNSYGLPNTSLLTLLTGGIARRSADTCETKGMALSLTGQKKRAINGRPWRKRKEPARKMMHGASRAARHMAVFLSFELPRARATCRHVPFQVRTPNHPVCLRDSADNDGAMERKLQTAPRGRQRDVDVLARPGAQLCGGMFERAAAVACTWARSLLASCLPAAARDKLNCSTRSTSTRTYYTIDT